MAKGNIRIVDSGGRTANPVRTFDVPASGSALIYAGEPVKLYGTAATGVAIGFYPIPLTDGETISSMYFIGIAAKDGTFTASAAGTLDVYLDIPGTLYAAHPKTANTYNTAAKIKARQFYRITMDLTSSAYTMDDAHALTNPWIVLGGNAANDEIYFTAAENATWRNCVTD